MARNCCRDTTPRPHLHELEIPEISFAIVIADGKLQTVKSLETAARDSKGLKCSVVDERIQFPYKLRKIEIRRPDHPDSHGASSSSTNHRKPWKYQSARVRGKPLSPPNGLASNAWYTFRPPLRNPWVEPAMKSRHMRYVVSLVIRRASSP
jgi:hypothetical protein